MNILRQWILRKRAQALADKWKALEEMQTEFSEYVRLYRLLQRAMDAVDDEAESVRRLGEHLNDGAGDF